MTRVLVTGASGFIGARLITLLAEAGQDVVAVARREVPSTRQLSICWLQADLTQPNALPDDAFAAVDQVVHLAGQAHSNPRDTAESRRQLKATNVMAPAALAHQAATAGVSRFVFVSSATVHGAESGATPFSETDRPKPIGLYAESKAAAETALQEVAAQSGIGLTVVRPPLVCGPGVKGNLARLIAWADKGWPLPSAVNHNRRSLIGLDDLCRFIELAARHPAAEGETFLVADDAPMSTGDLFRQICLALERTPRFLPLPTWLLAASLRPLGQSGLLTRLCGNFELDCAKAHSMLGWRPETAIGTEIARTVAAELRGRRA